MLGLISYHLQDSRPDLGVILHASLFLITFIFVTRRDQIGAYILSFLSETLRSVFEEIWSSPALPAVFSLIWSITNNDSEVSHCSARPARPSLTSFNLPELPR
jgi:hypothetical protein